MKKFLVVLMVLAFSAPAFAVTRDELLIQWGKLIQQKEDLKAQVEAVDYKMLKVVQEIKKLETEKSNEEKPADNPVNPASGR